MLTITVTGSGLRRLAAGTKALSETATRAAYSSAINHTGRVARTHAGRALSDQTGLSKRVGAKAMRNHTRSTSATLTYTVNGKGGDISLKYFKARETRKGVSAAPWNSRRVYPSTFMKAGWWPKRVAKANWNGQVFERTGVTKYVVREGRRYKSDNLGFRVVKSGLYIPTEMVQGATANAWQREGGVRLQPRIEHEVRRRSKGTVT